jgi:hypothetical protein
MNFGARSVRAVRSTAQNRVSNYAASDGHCHARRVKQSEQRVVATEQELVALNWQDAEAASRGDESRIRATNVGAVPGLVTAWLRAP